MLDLGLSFYLSTGAGPSPSSSFLEDSKEAFCGLRMCYSCQLIQRSVQTLHLGYGAELQGVALWPRKFFPSLPPPKPQSSCCCSGYISPSHAETCAKPHPPSAGLCEQTGIWKASVPFPSHQPPPNLGSSPSGSVSVWLVAESLS